MAKPGTKEARAIGLTGAVDLSQPITGKLGEDGIRQAEMRMGYRCNGCGERVGIGIKFTRFEPVLEGGVPRMNVMHVMACSRPECDFAERARDDAHVCEMVEFVWLGEPADETHADQEEVTSDVRGDSG